MEATWIYFKKIPLGVWLIGSGGLYYAKKNYTIATMKKMQIEQMDQLHKIDRKLDNLKDFIERKL